jgi:DNA-binding SARP family transcriptional activator
VPLATALPRVEDAARDAVTVELLGPVRVTGAARPLRRAWALELIVYLSMHPEGAQSDEWATALWPEQLMAGPTRYSIASSARRGLGRGRLGEDHLPHSHGRLQLGPGVSTDWRRFEALSASVRPENWSEALGLVRGLPFRGLRHADWCVLEGHTAAIEEAISSVGRRAAQHALECGDPTAAMTLARRALRASPYDERLYRTILLAADAAGNPAGVEAAMRELVSVLDGPGAGWLAVRAPEDLEAVVHPETAALYRRLSRVPPGAFGRVGPPPGALSASR